MNDDVEVTEDGEIVASNSGDDLRAGPDVDGWWRVCVSSYEYAAVCLSTATLAAWCRRVLREVDPDPVPTVDEAAIRADERARAEAEVLDRIEVHLRHARSVHLRHIRTVPGAAFTVPARGVEALEELADDIRAGKHRSTP